MGLSSIAGAKFLKSLGHISEAYAKPRRVQLQCFRVVQRLPAGIVVFLIRHNVIHYLVRVVTSHVHHDVVFPNSEGTWYVRAEGDEYL